MAPSGSAQPQINPWVIAVAVMYGTFMEVLDTLAGRPVPRAATRGSARTGGDHLN